jgi:hypothetical protein
VPIVLRPDNFPRQIPGVLLILPLFADGTAKPISDSAPLRCYWLEHTFSWIGRRFVFRGIPLGDGSLRLNARRVRISIGCDSLGVIWLTEQHRDGPQCFDFSLDAGKIVFFCSQQFLNVSH